MVDGVQLPQLGEQPGVGNVRPHVGPVLDPPGPVVGPVVHAARLERVGPDVVDIAANSPVWTGPEGEGLGQLRELLRHGGEAGFVDLLVLPVHLQSRLALVNVGPALVFVEMKGLKGTTIFSTGSF